MIAKVAYKACYLILFTLLSLAGKAQLKANFSSRTVSGCSPVVVEFSDNSTGSPTQWKWDLGNGTTSFLQNPSVTYFNPGTYTIKLIVKKGNATDSIIKVNFITVYGNPAINFSADKTSGCLPLAVKFTDSSLATSGSIEKWTWDFGDGNNTSTQSPEHTYQNAGNYNVTLKVFNNYGCFSTVSKTSYIVVSSAVTANFSITNPVVCSAPVNSEFKNLSVGSGKLDYQWNFGDSSNSTQANPYHSYSSKGTYNVKLIVTSSAGCADSVEKNNVVNISGIKAGFTSAENICLGKTINFTNSTDPTAQSIQWDFGDGTTSSDFNPSKQYQSEGTYDVKLVARLGNCSDSSTTKIKVLPSQKSEFSADVTTTCQPTLTVNFKNESIPATTYTWYFGDGDSSNNANPTHTYTGAGKYTVSLISVNSAGCSDIATKNSYIQIIPPVVRILNAPDSGCAPFTKSLSFSSNVGNEIISYIWDFGDGTTSTDKSPEHTFVNAGTYTITLITSTIGGCTDTTRMVNAIKASDIPHVLFNATPNQVCAIIPVEFMDQTPEKVTRWLWDFGDGVKSIIQNPTHLYTDTGYFDVELIAWDGGCPDTLKLEDYVYIKAPIAKFKTDISCIKPFEKTFTDKSIGADTWFWNFGDGTTSTEQNPLHTYAAVGNYEVQLTVHNNSTGCDYDTKQNVPVVVSNPAFFASDTIICKNAPVNFTVPVANRAFLTSYIWSFGDGKIAAGPVPSIIYSYTNAGVYDIKLTTQNTLGCRDTITKVKYIDVNGPTSLFESSKPGTCINTRIDFTDLSVSDGENAITKWVWNYGDGKKDTLSNTQFSHLYELPGTYTVSLKTIDSEGCSDVYNNTTAILITKPKAAFISKDTLSCVGKGISFTNQSQGLDLTYSWDFGDFNASSEVNSTETNPVQRYIQKGVYDVTLFATDRFGCQDTSKKARYINIVLPKADFTMSDSVSTCPPLMVYFTDHSEKAVSKKWDFGDSTFSSIDNPSHFYTTPGIYIVKQIITSAGGCVDIKEKIIEIRGPRGSFVYDPLTGCSPIKINFKATTKDNTSFIWDYSDGTTLFSKDSIVSHVYDHVGDYLPKMILVDKEGCTVAITGSDTVKVNGANAKFSISNKQFCDSGLVSFSDSSVIYDRITGYKWDFGNGDTAISKNAIYKYNTPGSYITKLMVVTSNGCKDTAVASSPIKVVASPNVAIINTFSGCVPLSQTFKGQIMVPDTSVLRWNWDLGNGNTSVLQNPAKQIYDTARVFDIKLTVSNSSGCSSSLQKTIEAFPIPNVSAGIDTMVCKGKSRMLQASGADKYVWKNDPTISCTNCESPLVNPTVETRYFVTGTTIAGCSNTGSVLVSVKEPFKIHVSKTDTLCKGEASKLEVNGAYSYVWTPGNGLSDATKNIVTAKPDTTTTYMVVGTDDRNCFNDTGYVRIKVYPIPSVNAGEDKTVNVGKTITMVPDVSSDVTNVSWSPSLGLVKVEGKSATIKPKQTTEYTVEAKNPGGCTSQDKVTIFVICNGANIFMPNTFSPNGDGMNDIYYPRGTGVFSIKTLRIFNRWGELVFERNNFNANDANAGWEGKYKGMPLNSDVYVYTLDVVCDNNELLTFKGNIALIN